MDKNERRGQKLERREERILTTKINGKVEILKSLYTSHNEVIRSAGEKPSKKERQIIGELEENISNVRANLKDITTDEDYNRAITAVERYLNLTQQDTDKLSIDGHVLSAGEINEAQH